MQESEGADEDGVVWMTDTSAEAAKQRAQVRVEKSSTAVYAHCGRVFCARGLLVIDTEVCHSFV